MQAFIVVVLWSKVRCLAKDETGNSFAHEAGVWVQPLNEVWFTSNLFSQGFVLFCDQGGDIEQSSKLILVDPENPHRAQNLINNFYGRQFNALNDVIVLPPPHGRHAEFVQSSDNIESRQELPKGSTIWFSTYGFEQSFRPAPQLPSQVHALDPHTGRIKVVADGFDHPNGIAFSPDGSICYITDTSHIHGTIKLDPHLQSTIQQNRRVLPFADTGVPDGNSYGTLIGRIVLRAADSNLGVGCANFCFIPGGKLVCFSENRVYLVEGLKV
ncbi:hypothetical protein L486_05727 [Kwoniella mangroviensis CBS 10435]|uniref:SMP-30/Gluconolactonase/LRE-like region domain-containing protein n=1 Tax=Kwoniella mangroviensis CBS 10435 TaxID=1331196 RepID=A0A1B9IMT0_9TREE|nr:hypothetical protein L486_05727 [Kwoniella mangroviensis CBS 10435]